MIRVHESDNPFAPFVSRTTMVDRPFARVRSLVPKQWRNGSVSAYLNGMPIPLDRVAFAGDHVHFTPGAHAASFTFKLVGYIALAVLSEALLRPRLPKSTRRDDNASPLYSFGGITPNRKEGQPIPRYYGRIRAGGQIVSEFVESRGAIGSWYNVLISYGYGPYRSIAGITEPTHPDQPLRSYQTGALGIPAGVYVNQTEAKDYADVEMHVRLGTNEQAAIPGFDRDVLVIPIERALTAPAGTVTTFDPFISPTAPSPTEDSFWATYGDSYDIVDRAVDAFTVKLRFPSGIFWTDSSNNLMPLSFALAVRYRELDGSLLPITTGGMDGDGYVRPLPIRRAILVSQGELRVDWTFPLYDPQTYTRPTLNGILRAAPMANGDSPLSGRRGYAERTAANMAGGSVPANWSESLGINEVTVIGWVALRTNGTGAGGFGVSSGVGFDQNSLNTPAPIISWMNEATKKGFELLLQTKLVTISPGQTRKRVVPTARIGNGATINEYYPRNGNGATGGTASELGDVSFPITVSRLDDPQSATWYRVAFTYKQDALGTNDRLRIYVNGELVFERYAAIDLKQPTAALPAKLLLGADGRNTFIAGDGDFSFRGWMQEVGVFAREWTAAEIESDYDDGAGVFMSTPADTFALYHFEEAYPTGVSGTAQSLADASGFGHTLTTVYETGSSSNYSSGVSKGFIGRSVVSNTVKRAKYQVEVMRATNDYSLGDGQDDVVWEAINTHVDQAFTHPGSVLLALRVKAQEQLNGQVPDVSSIIEGALVPVWDGVDVDHPDMPLTYTRNPAWIANDLCVNRRSGMGARVRQADIDLISTLEWANRNNEWVYDLRGFIQDIHSTDSSKAIDELGYTTLGGLVSSFFVRFRASMIGRIPKNYKVGSYVGFTGLPTPITDADVHLDMNEDGVGAWEIIAIDQGTITGTARLYLRYDTSTLPQYPWTSGGGPSGGLSGNVGSPMTGTMRGIEVRNRFDGGFDEAEHGWDALIDLCDTAGAAPLRLGSNVFFRVDMPRDPIDLVTPANCIAGTFEYQYTSDTKPNAMSVDILDEEQNFERAQVPDEHPSISGTSTLSRVRNTTARLRGVTRRSQAKRWMRETLNQNHMLRMSGKYTASVDALHHEPGDVLQVSSDLLPRGRGGRVLEGSTGTSVILDRPITIESGKSYRLAVRSSTAPASSLFEVRDVTNAAGTYAGLSAEAITVSSSFSFDPQLEDVFILHEVGTELLVRVRSVGLTRDLRREIQWVVEDSDVFIEDGSEIEDLPEVTLASQQAAATFSAGGAEAVQLPERVDGLEVEESTVFASHGSLVSGLDVSWRLADGQLLREVIVWVATAPSAWREAARMGPTATTCFIPLPRIDPGTTWTVAVQPVTRAGARREPAACGVRSVRAYGLSVAPTAPISIQASMQGTAAVYDLTVASEFGVSSYEIRRGGWILAPPIGGMPAGLTRLGPTADFATVASMSDPDGASSGAPIRVRARSDQGLWSKQAITYFDPTVVDAIRIGSVDAVTLASQEWREFGDGWIDDALPDQNSVLTNLARDAHGDLRFDGSALVGMFEMAEPETTPGMAPEDVYLSAFVVAYQIHPWTWAGATWSWSDPAASQMTWEGPLNDIGDGQDQRCTLALEVRFRQRDYSWAAWRAYQPSRAVVLGAQFRIVVTRPSAEFDVRIVRFSTEILRAALTKYDRSEVKQYLRARMTQDG